ncbi:hypothetical protein ACJMK2_043242 [Sinanodonta woodiana]|uniref:Uncharacterized protein n=1 Tax=Sinanodonta woodiana TaxID=1069815 RepID=A0ABD3VWA7_SINWO
MDDMDNFEAGTDLKVINIDTLEGDVDYTICSRNHVSLSNLSKNQLFEIMSFNPKIKLSSDATLNCVLTRRRAGTPNNVGAASKERIPHPETLTEFKALEMIEALDVEALKTLLKAI